MCVAANLIFGDTSPAGRSDSFGGACLFRRRQSCGVVDLQHPGRSYRLNRLTEDGFEGEITERSEVYYRLKLNVITGSIASL